MEKQELLVQINKLKDTIKEIEEILHRDDVKIKKFELGHVDDSIRFANFFNNYPIEI